MSSLSEFRENQSLITRILRGELRHAGEPFLAALAFVLMAALSNRFWEVYQHNPDEGYNLMKAALLASGYSLFSEVWSDQPPVFTFLLAALQLLSPGNVNASRALVLVFAGWIVFSLFRIVRRSHGNDAAWISVIALTASFTFSRISVYVLIGLPALSFALAGIDQALAGAASNKRWRFVLAGILVGLGLQTKFFTALMLPTIILAAFVGASGPGALWRATINVAVLLFLIAAVFVAIALGAGEPIIEQLILPHTHAKSVEKFASVGGPLIVWHSLQPQLALIAVPFGLLVVAMRRRLADMLPLVWLCIAVTVLVLHRPHWSHQAIMILVPAAWLGGVGLAFFNTPLYRRVAAAAVTVVLAVSVAETVSALHPDPPRKPLPSSLLGSDNKHFRKWAFSDFAMDAYRAKWLVPPELAVYSEKRLLAGQLPDTELIAIFDRYQPEQVVFRRFRPSERIVSSLQENYAMVPPRWGAYLHAVRRSEAAVRPEIRRDEVVAALEIATAAIASRSVRGGCEANVNFRTGQVFGRSLDQEPLQYDQITTRPLGSTQEVGQCLRKRNEPTNDELFHRFALRVGEALSCSPRNDGGWSAS